MSQDFQLQFFALWRVHVAVVIIQVTGGAIGLALTPFEATLQNAWLGGAIASFPGFLIGNAWQRAVSDQWQQTTRALRHVYMLCATLMTFVAAPLGAFVIRAFE